MFSSILRIRESILASFSRFSCSIFLNLVSRISMVSLSSSITDSFSASSLDSCFAYSKASALFFNCFWPFYPLICSGFSFD